MDVSIRAKVQIPREPVSGQLVPQGMSDIVNLLESRTCCFCGGIVPKRKQMWKFPDGGYMCIPCKTRLDTDTGTEKDKG
jgi:hypothetical protein